MNIPLTILFTNGLPAKILLSDTTAKDFRGFSDVSDIQIFTVLSDYSMKNGYNIIQSSADPFICIVSCVLLLFFVLAAAIVFLATAVMMTLVS